MDNIQFLCINVSVQFELICMFRYYFGYIDDFDMAKSKTSSDINLQERDVNLQKRLSLDLPIWAIER